MEEEQQWKKRFLELSERAYTGGRFCFSDFLGMSERGILMQLEREIGPQNITCYGGTDDCERVVARFGNAAELGYEEQFPIVCIKIEPLIQKFSDKLTHRDVLGALMSLGILRSQLGDIIISENIAYVFCLEKMSSYVIGALSSIKHTNVRLSITEDIPNPVNDATEVKIQVVSDRVDAIVSKLYALSRKSSLELFREKKVFINGRQCENNSCTIKPGEVVSVRGYGRFCFEGISGTTRKGNLAAIVKKY